MRADIVKSLQSALNFRNHPLSLVLAVICWFYRQEIQELKRLDELPMVVNQIKFKSRDLLQLCLSLEFLSQIVYTE